MMDDVSLVFGNLRVVTGDIPISKDIMEIYLY